MQSDCVDNIKKILLIQGIYSFLSGILYIVLPLLMVDRHINIVTIGLIFGALPVTFQLLRILFATLSDHFGRKRFVILHGISTTISSIIFYFAYTPLQFLAGKLTQSVEDATIWATNRPIILDHSKKKRYDLIILRVYDFSFGAVGTLIAGFLIAYLFFSNTVLFVIALGFLIIPFSFLIKDHKPRERSFRKAFSSLNFLNKSSLFKKIMIFYFIVGLSDGFSTSYIFPLFLSGSFSPEFVGILLGFQSLISGFSIFLFRKVTIKRTLIFGLSYSLLLFFTPMFGGSVLAIVVVLMGITIGLNTSGGEGLITMISNKKTYGGDIGVLLLGYNISRTIFLSISGLLIEAYGFTFLFAASSLLYVVSVFYAIRNIKG